MLPRRRFQRNEVSKFMENVRYRICTMKSRLGVGRYPDTEVGRLLEIEPNIIRYAYYHFEKIDFVDEVK